jgi:hypothetical protein
MTYGAVFLVYYAPESAEWETGQYVVLPCGEEMVRKTIPDGPNAGCDIIPLGDECIEYPPPEG